MKLSKIAAFSLAFVAGSAVAGPIGNVLGGVTGLLGVGANRPASGATATATASRMPIAKRQFAGKGAFAKRLSANRSSKALPGLGGAGAEATGPFGITLLQPGADGSGYDYVLNSDQLQPLADALSPLTNNVVSQAVLNGLTQALFQRDLVTNGTLLDFDHFIDDGLDNNLVTPLFGFDGDDGFIDVAILDGNGTARAGQDGILSAALISGRNTGNGGAIAAGVLNEGFSGNGGQIGLGILNDGPVSGNGGQIGIGILSGAGSGNGGALGIGLLNKNDLLHICGGGFCGSANDLIDMAGAIPQTELIPGIVLGGGKNAVASGNSNPLLNAGLLTGNDVGNGGLIGLGVLAGNNSAKGDLAGVCVLCGANASGGTLSVAALSGAGSGNSDGGILPLGIGVGALNDGLSGNGSDIGIAALSGAASGNGGQLGVGALNGALSGNGGQLGVGALNGGGSGNGGSIGIGAINAGTGGDGTSGGGNNGGNNGGSNGGTSGGGGIIGVGVINGPSGPTTDGNGGSGSDGGNDNVPDAGDEGYCALEVRDTKGKVVQTIKRPCKQLAKAKRQNA